MIRYIGSHVLDGATARIKQSRKPVHFHLPDIETYNVRHISNSFKDTYVKLSI